MENKIKRKISFAYIYKICPFAHIIALLSAAAIALFLVTRQNRALMAELSKNIVQPLHRALALFNSGVSFSVAEALIAAAVALVVFRLVWGLIMLIRRRLTARRVYKDCMGLLALVLFIYAGFSLLWGVFYYGDDFAAQSGLSDEPVSTAQLEAVTEYFAALANDCGAQVTRDGDGVYTVDRADILKRSASLFDSTVSDFPCLAGPNVAPKGVFFSRFLSLIDFTGFFFPFTAEANVNMDFPPSLFPSTVAHELSHQRGVAKEQEANFVAVLACLNSGDIDFCYSAALLAYTHLGNALYESDRAAWERIYGTLSEDVLRDFAANRAYWRQFDSPAQTVSNTVYEGFLQSYDQYLGMKSYGACVDLLVNYYYSKR